MYTVEDIKNNVIIGNTLEKLKEFPDESVNCCVTSPPYWGLRDYGTAKWIGGKEDCKHKPGKPADSVRENSTLVLGRDRRDVCTKCGAVREDDQIGLELTPSEYVNKMVLLFREIRRILKPDGTLWLNLGDCYAGSGGMKGVPDDWNSLSTNNRKKHSESNPNKQTKEIGYKPKDLIGIPWQVAFALREDGWYFRTDIVWCLSGGVKLYAKTPKGVGVHSVKDLVRIPADKVQLWNGDKWSNVVNWYQSDSKESIKITLRSGERIQCTPEHVWPTENGLVKTKDLKVGNSLQSKDLPNECFSGKINYLESDNIDTAFILGLFLAEGSFDGRDKLQFSLHKNETYLAEKINTWANSFECSCHYHVYDNSLSVIVEGQICKSIIRTFIKGQGSKNKRVDNKIWLKTNNFIKRFLNGYLEGDAHFEKDNNRYRLGFTRNYYLESFLRTVCARLGYSITLNPGISKIKDKEYQSFHGEIRIEVSNHFNNKDRNEIVKIEKGNARKFWDIEVEDDPHLFALASGVLTHNSKPNPMPESITDRPTRSHEFIFLLSKSQKYYYDHKAIKEKSDTIWNNRGWNSSYSTQMSKQNRTYGAGTQHDANNHNFRNKRTVWNVATKPHKEAHFAVFPEALIEPCILAGCPEDGIVLDPFMGSGTVAVVSLKNKRNYTGTELNEEYINIQQSRIGTVDVDKVQGNSKLKEMMEF